MTGPGHRPGLAVTSIGQPGAAGPAKAVRGARNATCAASVSAEGGVRHILSPPSGRRKPRWRIVLGVTVPYEAWVRDDHVAAKPGPAIE